MDTTFRRVKLGCYVTNVTTSIMGNLSPLLFVTFNTKYGIGYGLLGTLVLINFVSQLFIDLIFSFFSHKFNVEKTVKCMPVFSIVGLILYALLPFLMPNNIYLALTLGTIVFSVAGGLAEVLISPVVAAIPDENPDREMSKLHSIYAWGVVFVVAVVTIFFTVFGTERWQWLALSFALVPLLAFVLFFGQKFPPIETSAQESGSLPSFKNKTLWLCFFAIFLGGAMECTMSQWCSSYLEQALGISKVWGDIGGVATFAVMLGLGRSLYAKRGKNIEKLLLLCAIGTTICYIIATFSNVPLIGLIACAATGLTTSMLWPGSLIVSAERIPDGGVFVYAMMAAGGDLGASVSPQLVGIIADCIQNNPTFVTFAESLGLTGEQFGLKCGIFVGVLFSLCAVFLFLHIFRTAKKNDRLLNKKA